MSKILLSLCATPSVAEATEARGINKHTTEEFVVIASLLAFCDAGCVDLCSLCGAWIVLNLSAIVPCCFARLCYHTANWQNKFRKRNVSERYRVGDQSGTVKISRQPQLLSFLILSLGMVSEIVPPRRFPASSHSVVCVVSFSSANVLFSWNMLLVLLSTYAILSDSSAISEILLG